VQTIAVGVTEVGVQVLPSIITLVLPATKPVPLIVILSFPVTFP